TLNPKPSTLTLNPSTLIPEPSTLNPQPSGPWIDGLGPRMEVLHHGGWPFLGDKPPAGRPSRPLRRRPALLFCRRRAAGARRGRQQASGLGTGSSSRIKSPFRVSQAHHRARLHPSLLHVRCAHAPLLPPSMPKRRHILHVITCSAACMLCALCCARTVLLPRV
ncbi:hypothetical protein T484DRAFT_3648900, partial [Baffinella frigidus]